MVDAKIRSRAGLTVVLCCMAAALEGVDLQSMGIAARGLRGEFGLSAAQFGNAASISLAGLLVGAVIGGRSSDVWGRKRVLVAAMVALGVFSLATAMATGYVGLLVVRFLVGLGLGGAFPTLIAIVTEATAGPRKTLPLSFMYAGLPMGTVVGTLMVLHYGPAFQWRWIFYLGGVGPLLLAPVLALALADMRTKKTPEAAPAPLMPVRTVLFGAGRGTPTVLLWAAFFFTLLVIYLLTNWLNQLMTGRGFSPVEATIVLLAFGVGSVTGSLGLGLVLDAGYRRFTGVATYVGLAASLGVLALAPSYPVLIVAGAMAGFCAVGAQLVNYALAASYYPIEVRGAGVGWTVAVGRTGSYFGPLLGGLLLSAGFSASTVILMFVPTLLIAAVASTLMLTNLKAGGSSL